MARPSDIIVIGAGIVGCAVAEELSRRGASVEIVDERSVGMGATQASAGVLAPYLEAREDGPFLDLTVRSLALFDQFVERVSAESGVPVSYRRTGTLDVATTDAEMRVAVIRALGAVGGPEAHAAIPGLIAAVADPDARVQQAAAEVLGEFGTVARDAVPSLRRALQTGAPKVQKAAGEALLNIMRPGK